MKKWTWAWLAGVAGAVAIAAALAWPDSDVNAKHHGEGAAKAAPSRDARARSASHSARNENERDIDELLADGSGAAWKNIVALYPDSSEDTKLKVLRRIAKFPELKSTLGYVLATVGDDPTPAAEDPMVAEAGELLKGRWQTPEDFDYGRQTMLRQETDKRRWVVANALITLSKGVGDDSPLHAQKTRFKAKLVDLHGQIQSEFIRSSVVEGLHSLGGEDAALILAKGPGVRDDELEGVRQQQAAANEVLKRP